MGDGDVIGDGDGDLPGDGDGSLPGAGGASTASGGATGSGSSPGSGGTTVAEPCVDAPAPYNDNWPDATCEKWANETSECGEEWFQEYCDVSCGRCTPGGTGGSGNGGSGPGVGGSTGEGNPFGPVTGNQTGWASRYWDCCKQSCSWPGKGGNSPVLTCGPDGNSVVDANTGSTCDSTGGTTCNSFAPWAYSNDLSFGFVATHAGAGVTCGTCYKIQFTGSSYNGGADPGSVALNGKVMVVMATNIGGDVAGNGQLDLLIPGGGVGSFYGCDETWGIQSKTDPALGQVLGGLRSDCSGNLDQIKSCVANKCQSLFGSRGLTEMYQGCMWYVDWFQAANNPNFKVEEISCPSELTEVAK